MNVGANVMIRVGTIAECVAISKKIPEFSSGNYEEKDYKDRLFNTKHLILVALQHQTIIGFKVGYDRDKDGSFYSWLGGVVPEWRQMNVARLLAETQEKWALQHGYGAVVMKTRNRFKAMLLFAIKNDFCIEAVEARGKTEDNRIILRKILINEHI